MNVAGGVGREADSYARTDVWGKDSRWNTSDITALPTLVCCWQVPNRRLAALSEGSSRIR